MSKDATYVIASVVLTLAHAAFEALSALNFCWASKTLGSLSSSEVSAYECHDERDVQDPFEFREFDLRLALPKKGGTHLR